MHKEPQAGPGPVGSGSFRVPRRIAKRVASLALGAVTLAVPATWLVAAAPAACASTLSTVTQEEQGGIVVQSAPEREQSFCIGFEGDSKEGDPEGISGLAALRETGLPIVTKDFGGELGEGVCKIGDVGTDTCDFTAGYWAYFHGTPAGGWETSPTGASSYRFHDGSVDGWVWTAASTTEPSPPDPPSGSDAICAAANAPPPAAEAETSEEQDLLPWLGAAVGVAIAAIVAVGVARRRRSRT